MPCGRLKYLSPMQRATERTEGQEAQTASNAHAQSIGMSVSMCTLQAPTEKSQLFLCACSTISMVESAYRQFMAANPFPETISLKLPSSYAAYISDVWSCSRAGQEVEENLCADLLWVILG